jgi:hypothetical protein
MSDWKSFFQFLTRIRGAKPQGSLWANPGERRQLLRCSRRERGQSSREVVDIVRTELGLDCLECRPEDIGCPALCRATSLLGQRQCLLKSLQNWWVSDSTEPCQQLGEAMGWTGLIQQPLVPLPRTPILSGSSCSEAPGSLTPR